MKMKALRVIAELVAVTVFSMALVVGLMAMFNAAIFPY